MKKVKSLIDRKLVEGAIKEDNLVKKIKLDVIKPDERHIYTDTIMDVCPIATKVDGELGRGVTKICDGVVFMLTGVDEEGTQVHEFGSSEGYLDEKCILAIQVVLMRRISSFVVKRSLKNFQACQDLDRWRHIKHKIFIIQAVREELKRLRWRDRSRRNL